MDIQIDLRRPDFEAMHPTAKLFGFNEEAKMYFGELDSSTNKQWTTWCACLGMLHLEAGRSKEVPEWISVDSEEPPLGTMVLICWSDAPDIEPEKDYMEYEVDFGTRYWANCNDGDEPSHWMPLPKPVALEQSHE